MNIRCIYCHHAWECKRRPRKCPACTTPFSLTVTSDTPLRKIVAALDKNGMEPVFDLKLNVIVLGAGDVRVTLAG